MTGSEFYNYVLRKFKRTDKETEVYEAMTDVIADMRIRFLSEDYKEEAYITGISTVGDYRLPLPSDFGHIIGNISVTKDSTSYPDLIKISKQEYDEKNGSRLLSSSTDKILGTPTHFCIYAKQVYLYPVPDSTDYKYYLNYTTEDFSTISSATTSVPFTDKYRNILRSGVLAELYEGLEEYEEASFHRDRYISGLDSLAINDFDNVKDDENVKYNDF